jgi:hypothetical protein
MGVPGKKFLRFDRERCDYVEIPGEQLEETAPKSSRKGKAA